MTDTLLQLDAEACQDVPEIARIEGPKRRVILRRAKYMVLDELHRGERDTTTIEERVTEKLKADPVVGSIIAIIAVAVLSGLIQWLIKKLLDNWFSEVDDA